MQRRSSRRRGRHRRSRSLKTRSEHHSDTCAGTRWSRVRRSPAVAAGPCTGADATRRVAEAGTSAAAPRHKNARVNRRKVGRVGGPLNGEQRRAGGGKGEAACTGELGSREDHSGADPAVEEPSVVSDGQRRLASIGLSRHRDPVRLDQPREPTPQGPRRRQACA